MSVLLLHGLIKNYGSNVWFSYFDLLFCIYNSENMNYILWQYIDHFTVAPTTKELQRGYMEYILWRCIIAPPSHLRQRRYFRNMEYILWRYVITPPSYFRIVSTAEINGVYTTVVHNYFAIAPTIEEIYQKYGVYTMEVHNYSTLSPSTEYLRRRYIWSIYYGST